MAAGDRCWAESRAVGMQWQQRWAVEGVQTGVLIVRSLVAEALEEVPAGVALRDVALTDDLRCRYERARRLLARAVAEARALGVVVAPVAELDPDRLFRALRPDESGTN
ncbi:hypothetical protein AAT18_22720 [Rhodococcus aetherivorans]|nr:hypothetical protein AAT18_22720 [Rhodococcus aetherivorans]